MIEIFLNDMKIHINWSVSYAYLLIKLPRFVKQGILSLCNENQIT